MSKRRLSLKKKGLQPENCILAFLSNKFWKQREICQLNHPEVLSLQVSWNTIVEAKILKSWSQVKEKGYNWAGPFFLPCAKHPYLPYQQRYRNVTEGIREARKHSFFFFYRILNFSTWVFSSGMKRKFCSFSFFSFSLWNKQPKKPPTKHNTTSHTSRGFKVSISHKPNSRLCEIAPEKSSNPQITLLQHFQGWSSQDSYCFWEFTFSPSLTYYSATANISGKCSNASKSPPSVLTIILKYMVLNRQGRRIYPVFLWLCPQSQRPDG